MDRAFDLVVRGGTVVDGSGAARFEADVGVRDGRIAAVGAISGSGAEEIDARGQIVTPGFVDIHTHYDGQATPQFPITTVVTPCQDDGCIRPSQVAWPS